MFYCFPNLSLSLFWSGQLKIFKYLIFLVRLLMIFELKLEYTCAHFEKILKQVLYFSFAYTYICKCTYITNIMAEMAVEKAMVTVTYDITEDLVKEKIPFIGTNDFNGIAGVFIDDRPMRKPSKTISFSKPGVHVVKIALEDGTVIPSRFLCGAKNIRSIEIPESVTVIGWKAFSEIELKQKPVLPSGLKKVGGDAFEGVYNGVELLQLPDSLETIDKNAFKGIDHLVTGKCFKAEARYQMSELMCYKKVTISEDNIYHKVCDGFVINRENGVVEGLLPGIYEDTPATVLRIPEGVTGFNYRLFESFRYASIEVPGSVEECSISFERCSDEVRKISLASGVKKLSLGAWNTAEVILSIPETVKDFCFWRIFTDTLVIPDNAVINMDECFIDRLEIGSGVKIRSGYMNHIEVPFKGFNGEIFFGSTVEIEKFGYMNDEAVIHVQDYETGLSILESPGFNRKVKIFVGEDQPLKEQADGYQEHKFLQLLGCPGYKKTLRPLELSDERPPSCVTLMFDFPEKTTLNIQHSASALIIDDGKPKKQRGRCTDEPLVSKEFDMPEGQHIVRILNQQVCGIEDALLILEPACETMLIDDMTSMAGKLEQFKGIKHIILGAMCNIKEIACPVERVSVVPQNKWLEMMDGCLVEKETKTLIFAPVGTTTLPQGIKSIQANALRNYTHDRLVIPSSAKQICLNNLTGGFTNLKELVFEEGVEDISIEDITFLPDAKITFPSTLRRIYMCNVSVDRVEIPAACELDKFRRSRINSLTFAGDVELRPSPVTELDYSFWPYKSYTVNYNAFDDFSGNITFRGKVGLLEGFGHMHDGSLIHVQDNETGLSIFESPGFNKNVKIFIGGERPLGAQADEEQRLLQLLGCPGYKKTLRPLEPRSNSSRPSCATLMFDFPENTLLHMRCDADAMMVDDGGQEYPRTKIPMSKGQHVVRLLGLELCRDKEAPAFEPACETMLIDDTWSLTKISQNLMGVKHLILGAQCEIQEISCPVKRVSVVPENKWLEVVGDCLVHKETKALIFVPAGTTTLPQGIMSIQRGALGNYAHDRLVIPSTVKKVSLNGSAGGCTDLKELVFEEGVEGITIYNVNFLPDVKITFPSTLKRINMYNISADTIEIPVACELDMFRYSRINNLILVGDVALRPSPLYQESGGVTTEIYHNTFDDFSGNVTFRGEVSLRVASETGGEGGNFFGKMKDGGTITVADQATCDLIKSAKDYNSNVTITVE